MRSSGLSNLRIGASNPIAQGAAHIRYVSRSGQRRDLLILCSGSRSILETDLLSLKLRNNFGNENLTFNNGSTLTFQYCQSLHLKVANK
jgi:hypothetical protein